MKRVPARGPKLDVSQFLLLTAVNVLVGSMVGHERTILPLLARERFGVTAATATAAFVIAFGAVKALTNLVAGHLSDRVGRRPVLLFGWIAMVPVPIVLAITESWTWVIASNALLGAGQGLAWSATVVMQIDLAGPARRGFAAGINEAAGYLGVSIAALGTGVIASAIGLRPVPFLVAGGFALAGLGLASRVRETRSASNPATVLPGKPGLGTDASVRSRLHTATVAQAGAVNNLNDAVAWILFPLLFASSDLPLGTIAILVAVYPGAWGLGQLATGPVSDRFGRRALIVAGMWSQSIGLASIALGSGLIVWTGGTLMLGLGTAMAYPSLLAAVDDAADPHRRASALGTYRFWRDAGFVAGGLLAAVFAGAIGVRGALALTAAVTFVSGTAVASVRSTGSRWALHSGRPSSSRRAR